MSIGLAALADRIDQSLHAVLSSPVGAALAESGRTRIQEAQARANELSEQLRSIHAEVVTLEEPSRIDSEAARQRWENLPSGLLKPDSEGMIELRRESEVLDEFYRAGIDVTQIIKLSRQEMDVSCRIGDCFARVHRVWDRVKNSINRKRPCEMRLSDLEDAMILFNILRDTNVLPQYETDLFVYKEKIWKAAPLKKLQRLKSRENPVRFRFDLDPSYRGLLTGHWFNGYVYDALRDQLDRLELDCELFPLVSYCSRVNAALSRGEFDVLGRIRQQRIIVECKSGRMRSKHHDDYPVLLGTHQALEEIFARTRLAKGIFIIVYNPFLNDPAEVAEMFGDSGIRTIPIDDMRGRIIDLVNEISAKEDL